jgi:hypothetical protein
MEVIDTENRYAHAALIDSMGKEQRNEAPRECLTHVQNEIASIHKRKT